MRGSRGRRRWVVILTLQVPRGWLSTQLTRMWLKRKGSKPAGRVLIVQVTILDQILNMVDNFFREVPFCSFSTYHKDHN